MTEDPLHTSDVSSDTPLKPISEEDSGEKTLGGKQPSSPFDLKNGKGAESPQEEAISPMGLAAGPINRNQGIPTTEELSQQAHNISNQIDATKPQLQTPGLQFKPSTHEILTQHANQINENLNSISSRLNLPKQQGLVPGQQQQSGASQFLDYLTGSQKQMQDIAKTFQNPPPNGFQPGDLLAIQAKMNNVQLQVEFFTVLLGKAVSSIQTVMNIQN